MITLKSIQTEKEALIGGNLKVRGSAGFENALTVGSDIDIGGKATVKGDLKVDGIFEARDFVGMLKGLFASVDALYAAYPRPRDGLTALVGDTIPADVYRARRRKWIPTGEQSGMPSLQLDAILSRLSTEEKERKEADRLLDRRVSIAETVMMITVDTQAIGFTPDTYYNLRGKQTGDSLDSIIPEPTKEEGLYSGRFSFDNDKPKLLRLTSKGTDMIRNYCALDADFRILDISADGDYQFDDRTVELPAATRHLLLQSYSVIPKAKVFYRITETQGGSRRIMHPQQRSGVCFDYGTNGGIGDFFDDSQIKFVASIPDSRIAILDWKDTYKVTVTMNTGTPNVWGIAYLNSQSRVIGYEQPLRRNLVQKELKPPTGTKRIVFQTYDGNIFPMVINVEYDLLDMLEELVAGQKLPPSQTILPASGEKWLVMGDSIMEFADETGKKVSDYLAEKSGAEILNIAFGGTRLTRRADISGIAKPATMEEAYALLDLPSLSEALESGDISKQSEAIAFLKNAGDDNSNALAALQQLNMKNLDRIIILAGTNDYASGIDAADRSTDSRKSIPAAMDIVVTSLQKAAPFAQILICTPPPRMYDTSDPSTFSDSYIRPGAKSSLPQICAAIAESARKYHLPVADLYNTLGWTATNYAAQCLPGDGTHPRRNFQSLATQILHPQSPRRPAPRPPPHPSPSSRSPKSGQPEFLRQPVPGSQSFSASQFPPLAFSIPCAISTVLRAQARNNRQARNNHHPPKKNNRQAPKIMQPQPFLKLFRFFYALKLQVRLIFLLFA